MWWWQTLLFGIALAQNIHFLPFADHVHGINICIEDNGYKVDNTLIETAVESINSFLVRPDDTNFNEAFENGLYLLWTNLPCKKNVVMANTMKLIFQPSPSSTLNPQTLVYPW